MVAVILLDTHVVVWLYAGMVERFPDRVKELLETSELAISPMTFLDLQYLYEIGRVGEPARAVVDDLNQRVGLEITDTSLSSVALAAAPLSWTRDAFDRLLAAQALASGTRLVTADKKMRENLDLAVWE